MGFVKQVEQGNDLIVIVEGFANPSGYTFASTTNQIIKNEFLAQMIVERGDKPDFYRLYGLNGSRSNIRDVLVSFESWMRYHGLDMDKDYTILKL